MASSKQSLALLLAVLAAAAAAPASAAAGVPACGQVRKITVQNLCNHDLPLTLSLEAGSHELFAPGFVLRRGTHVSFPVCSWAGRLAAAGGAQARRRRRRRVVQRDLHPAGARHRRAARGPARGGGRLLGHCPAVGCGAGHGRCARETAAGSDCRNVDEIKIIYFDHRQ
ncbi:unnamed protein product [Urochloa decumbens]|uniref:Uncharacterized protein n=1 Tax=Urochloa decumbens TaxID=240449 RepID=A0ABC8VX67_9POAL